MVEAKTTKPAAEPNAAKPAAEPKAKKPVVAESKSKNTRLGRDYDERIVKAMTEKFGYKNRMEVPRLGKIVLNMGVGEASQDKKKVEIAAAEMELIAGQKPVIALTMRSS